VSPLLQFYGAQALSKAAILTNDDSVRLSDISYHGLSTRPTSPTLQQYASSSRSWALEQEFAVKRTNGVFPQLCHSVGDAIPADGEVLTLKELLRVIPDLKALFHRHYGEMSNCIRIYSGPTKDKEGRTEIYFSNDIGDVWSLFPEFNDGFEECEINGVAGFRSVSTDDDPISFGAIELGTVAGRYFVRPLASGIHKSFSVLLAAMFVLSNVVRYKPAFWMRELQGSQSGGASVAQALTNLAKRRLPNDALESIWNERVIYGTPGYVT